VAVAVPMRALDYLLLKLKPGLNNFLYSQWCVAAIALVRKLIVCGYMAVDATKIRSAWCYHRGCNGSTNVCHTYQSRLCDYMGIHIPVT
jgi:hypothetical protein